VCQCHKTIHHGDSFQHTAYFAVPLLCRTAVGPCLLSETPCLSEIARSLFLSARELFPSTRRSTSASLSRPRGFCMFSPAHWCGIWLSVARPLIAQVPLLQPQNNTEATLQQLGLPSTEKTNEAQLRTSENIGVVGQWSAADGIDQTSRIAIKNIYVQSSWPLHIMSKLCSLNMSLNQNEMFYFVSRHNM